MFKFRKFAAISLFLAGTAGAAINISTAGNNEIENFITSEASKTLQVPSSAVLTLNFQTAKDKHSRAGFLFFWGEREVSISADYTITLENSEQLKGTLKADTSWFTGYCGMIECQTKPMPSHQRIETLKALVPRILTELNDKCKVVFAEQPNQPTKPDNLAPTPVDSTATADSVTTPAVEDGATVE